MVYEVENWIMEISLVMRLMVMNLGTIALMPMVHTEESQATTARGPSSHFHPVHKPRLPCCTQVHREYRDAVPALRTQARMSHNQTREGTWGTLESNLMMIWECASHPAHTGWGWLLRQGSSRNDHMEQGFRAHSGISKGSRTKVVGVKATCNSGGGKRLAK